MWLLFLRVYAVLYVFVCACCLERDISLGGLVFVVLCGHDWQMLQLCGWILLHIKVNTFSCSQ